MTFKTRWTIDSERFFIYSLWCFRWVNDLTSHKQ
jgi:hypothetical protein